MSRAEVKWMGDGTWEPESVCFDWTNEDFKVKSLGLWTLVKDFGLLLWAEESG